MKNGRHFYAGADFHELRDPEATKVSLHVSRFRIGSHTNGTHL